MRNTYRKHLNAACIDTGQSLPLPGTAAYEALPQFPKGNLLPFRRTIRRHELRQIVPLAEVWNLAEVKAWIEERKQAPRANAAKPDVHP